MPTSPDAPGKRQGRGKDEGEEGEEGKEEEAKQNNPGCPSDCACPSAGSGRPWLIPGPVHCTLPFRGTLPAGSPTQGNVTSGRGGWTGLGLPHRICGLKSWNGTTMTLKVLSKKVAK
jgi:hypothetical protein